MPLPKIVRHEDLVANLVHDLRQPLGNIETSLYLLNLWMPPGDQRIQAQMRAMERQLHAAICLLAEASAALNPMRPQRGPETESLDLTNAVTAAVT